MNVYFSNNKISSQPYINDYGRDSKFADFKTCWTRNFKAFFAVNYVRLVKSIRENLSNFLTHTQFVKC